MTCRLAAPITLAVALTACQATERAPSYNNRVEAAAAACADEINARSSGDKSNGSITWISKETPGSSQVVGLPYIELDADDGATWRACMTSRGVPTGTLDLGNPKIEPQRYTDIG